MGKMKKVLVLVLLLVTNVLVLNGRITKVLNIELRKIFYTVDLKLGIFQQIGRVLFHHFLPIMKLPIQQVGMRLIQNLLADTQILFNLIVLLRVKNFIFVVIS